MRELIERAARIIDPGAWVGSTYATMDMIEARERAVAKAEAILALSLLPDVEEGGSSAQSQPISDGLGPTTESVEPSAAWLDIALGHLDGAAEALRQHGDEYRAQLIEAGAYAIRRGSAPAGKPRTPPTSPSDSAEGE